MMAELYGKSTGTNRGKGGSMHITDVSVGMLGVNPIVGMGTPHAVGAALSARVRGTDQVAVAFFGEGAASMGVVHEAMNLAAIWKLPVVFVCENNGYAQATPVEYALACDRVADRAAAYRMPGVTVDGQDVLAVFAAADEAVRRGARRRRAEPRRVHDLPLPRPPPGRRHRCATGRRRRSARRASATALPLFRARLLAEGDRRGRARRDRRAATARGSTRRSPSPRRARCRGRRSCSPASTSIRRRAAGARA